MFLYQVGRVQRFQRVLIEIFHDCMNCKMSAAMAFASPFF